MPAHSGQVHYATTVSLLQSFLVLAGGGTVPMFRCWPGDSLLPHARNTLLAHFLTTECTDLVFVDADVAWEEPETLVRLLSHDVDFVAGVYRHKRDPESYPINWLPKPELWADPATGLLEVADVPMGFTRMRRAMVQKIFDAYSMKAYRHHSAPDLECRAVFELEWNPCGFFGEDFVFCKRWRDLGGKVWIDPDLTLTHVGLKTFDGNIGKWLKSQIPAKEAAE
jgi:hypothetical protein